MKLQRSGWLALALLVVGANTHAQVITTYNVDERLNAQKGVGTAGYMRVFGIGLTDADDSTQTNDISWLQINPASACPGQAPPFYGFIYVNTPNQTNPNNCTPITGFSVSPELVFDSTGKCHGPLSETFSFTGNDVDGVPFSGVGTFYFSYRYQGVSSGRGGGGAGCYQNILANTTVTNPDGSQAVLTSTVVITQ